MKGYSIDLYQHYLGLPRKIIKTENSMSSQGNDAQPGITAGRIPQSFNLKDTLGERGQVNIADSRLNRCLRQTTNSLECKEQILQESLDFTNIKRRIGQSWFLRANDEVEGGQGG